MARSKNKLKAEAKNKQVINEYEEHIEQNGGFSFKENKKQKRRRRWRRFFIFTISSLLFIFLFMFIFVNPIGKDGLVYCLTLEGPSDTLIRYKVAGYVGNPKEIDIPKRHLFIPIVRIDGGAFVDCDSLTSITIPDSINSIISSFANCDNLESITIPDSVTSIYMDAFLGCTSLKDVYITDIAAWCNISFNSNTGNPLYYAKNLYLNGKLITELVIPEHVTSIGDYVFSGCSSLESIIIPDSVTSIGKYAFSGCDNLIHVENGVSYVDRWVIDCDTSRTAVTLRENTVGIADNAFSGCSNLKSIIIPDSVTSIGKGAFYGCSSLKGVTIPDSVTSIGVRAFYGCDNLIHVENGVSYVDRWVIDCDTSRTAVTLRENTVGIADNAFSGCSNLKSITIPDSVTSIGSYAFEGCTSLAKITVDDDNEYYTSIDGNLYTKDGKVFIQYARGKTDSEFTIPDSVTSIGDYAFFSCDSLASITIPDSVTSIGVRAFYGCDNLTSVNIGNGVTTIGKGAFYCPSLKDVYYNGDKKDWKNIHIYDRSGSHLFIARIHYNYVED